jgi:hypothetical protein
MISNKIYFFLGCVSTICLISCGGDTKTTIDDTTEVVKEVVQDLAVSADTIEAEPAAVEEIVEAPVEAKKEAPQMSDKDRLENEKFRMAELERRRQLAMQANPGLILPKPKPAPVVVAAPAKKTTAPAKKVVTKTKTTTTKTVESKSASVPEVATKEKVISTPSPKKTEPVVAVKEEPKAAPVTKKPAPTGKAEITFDKVKFAFDTIVEGDIINHKFRFVNTGQRPIEILNAKASCGCTMPSFPFLTIEPGAEGFIGVTYNSRTKEGKQTPEIEVTTNYQDEPLMLYLDGYVKDKEESSEEVNSEDQGK